MHTSDRSLARWTGPLVGTLLALTSFHPSSAASDNPAPMVGVQAGAKAILEPPPEAGHVAARFRVIRSGPPNGDLVVWLRSEGSATAGEDYEPLPAQITIPDGREAADLPVVVLADELVEAAESVVVVVEPDPSLGPLEHYRVDPRRATARMVILDNPRPSDGPRLEVVAPVDGAKVTVGDVVRVETRATDPEGFLARLEYLANGQQVGESVVGWPECVGCEPKPGEPAHHVFEWKPPAIGRYQLVARATHRVVFEPAYEEQALTPAAVSSPVWVTVAAPSPSVRLSIRATRPIAEETAEPYDRLPLVGEFLISRTGDVTEPVSAYLSYHGRAENGVDCELLPSQVAIAAGATDVRVPVRAVPDAEIEGLETLVARLWPCPPPEERGPTSGAPCDQMGLDLDHASARVLICDNARWEKDAGLWLIAPKAGARFPAGSSIELEAVAVDPAGGIYRVEFWNGKQRLGVSEVWPFRPLDPGEPMNHAFVWEDAEPGMHLLTARAQSSSGVDLVSSPVMILVQETGAIRVAILEPSSGAVYAPEDGIEIHAAASAHGGEIARLEIVADGAVVGSAEKPELRVRWDPPGPGIHGLVARATGRDGQVAVSQPVRLMVRVFSVVDMVKRKLPPAYAPGRPFEVRLLAALVRPGGVWAVADRPPKGWVVSDISHEGVWDGDQSSVKFGPFSDANPRVLGYWVTPPADAEGAQQFTGDLALNGKVVAVGGDRTVEAMTEHHPADRAPEDFAISVTELTAYAGAWKEGQPWAPGAAPIPLSYVTRAGQIWRQGEGYRLDAEQGSPPRCWVPVAEGDGPGLHRQGWHRAERTLKGPATPGARLKVELVVAADEAVGAYAIEEALPDGWGFDGADGEGVYHPGTRQIRWGPFYEAGLHRLTYRIVPPPGIASVALLRGTASFDGEDQPILGAQAVLSEDATTEVRVLPPSREGRGMRFQISGSPGQLCLIEATTDLEVWAPHGYVFVPEGGVVEVEDAAPATGWRFFRVRPVVGD